MTKKKGYCFTNKKGKKVCTKNYVVKADSTPYVQEPDTGLMLGRVSKKKVANLPKK